MTLEKTPLHNRVSGANPSAATLQIFVGDTGDRRTHMVLEGELDASSAPLLREKLVELTSDLEGDLVVDIGQLTFIDSSGLALFVTEHKKLKAQGSNLVIFVPSGAPTVRDHRTEPALLD